MALTDVSPGGIPEKGVTYSKITSDGSVADIDAIPNDTYFYDLSDDLPYYKTSLGLVKEVYSNVIKNPKVYSVTEISSLTINPLDSDMQLVLQQNQGITMGAPTDTPHEGSRMTIRLKDDGTARNITWNSIFRGIRGSLPSKTIPGETLYVDLIYNNTDSKWDVISSSKNTVNIFTARLGSYTSVTSGTDQSIDGGNILLAAKSLSSNGSWIDFEVFGNTASNADAKDIKLRIDNTIIARNSAVDSPNGVEFRIKARCIRISNSQLKCFTETLFDGEAVEAKYTSVTGLDLDGTDSNFILTSSVNSAGDVTTQFFTGTITNF
jgi:hypothetical protein